MPEDRLSEYLESLDELAAQPQDAHPLSYDEWVAATARLGGGERDFWAYMDYCYHHTTPQAWDALAHFGAVDCDYLGE